MKFAEREPAAVIMDSTMTVCAAGFVLKSPFIQSIVMLLM